MKTVFINGSPKKRFSASSYFLSMARLFTRGSTQSERLRSRGDYERLLSVLEDADNVVFCVPLYVDSLPSHVLAFLQLLEARGLRLNVYAISNGGFIEGKQSEPLFRVLENFCARSGNHWCGGVGVGGGVMLNVTRILFVVELALFVLQLLCAGLQTGVWFPADEVRSCVIDTLVLVFLNAGVLLYILRLAAAASRGAATGERYTRILIPSFLFILIADLFFLILSILKGGLFRGWLKKK